MPERQCKGIAKAKREGRYKGRVPTTRRQATSIAEQFGRDAQQQRIVHAICNTASAEWCLCGGGAMHPTA
jgi:DNA invertase Pin-like site-specific DNA recombinase